MKTNIQKLLVGASVALCVSAIGTNPASAASITGAEVTGTAPNNFEVWDVDQTVTCEAQFCLGSKGTDTSNLTDILAGTASAPGGNIELFKTSEVGFPDLESFLNYDKVTSLDIDFDDGTGITLSSLTAKDLFGSSLDTSYTSDTVATKWFNDAFDANVEEVISSVNSTLSSNPIIRPILGVGSQVDDEAQLYTAIVNGLTTLGYGSEASKFSSREAIFDTFLNQGGFQRSVDPNVAFVNKNGNNVEFGLAGHANLVFYAPDNIVGALEDVGIDFTLRASELVKVSYPGKEDIMYSFTGSSSNVASNDGSFNFTYVADPALKANTPSAPEPSFMLGSLLAAGGMFAAKRKQKK